MALIPKQKKNKTTKTKTSKGKKTSSDKAFRGKDKLQPGSRGGVICGK